MRRGLARVVRVLLALVGGLVLLAAAAIVFFMTDPGEALMKRFLVARINERIEGRVTVDDLRFAGDSLELAAVRLADPQGREVLTIGRFGADAELTSLLRGRLVLDRLSASDAHVVLWRTPEGAWSLARALTPREPTGEGGQLPNLSIEQVALEAVQLDVELASTGRGSVPGVERLRAQRLGLTGWLSIRDQHLEADLNGHGRLVEPEEAPIDARANARYESDEQRLELQGSIGAASARVDVRVPDGLTLADAGVDALQRLSAAIFVDAPAVELGGLEYGPLRLDAQLRNGRLSLPVLELELPGLRVTRQEPSEDTAVAARVDLDSLSTLAQALRAVSGRELPPLSGQGGLQLSLAGPLDAVRARLSGTLRGLEVGDSGARSLSVIVAAVPFADDAPAPAHVQIEAETLTLMGYAVGHVALDARLSEGGHLTLTAEAAGSTPTLRVRAEGQRAGDAALNLEELTLSYPNTSWNLAQPPARLRWGDDTGVELTLQSGKQRIELELEDDSNRTRLRAALDNVRLASVPRSLVKSVSGRRVARGTVDARLAAERLSSVDSWTGDARLELSEGRWGSIRDISFALDARAEEGRAQGTFRADVLSGRARGSFELPARWPPPEGAALRADARIVGLRLGALWRAIGRRTLPSGVAARVRSVSGALAARARIEGRWPSPELTARVEVEDGAVQLTSGERFRDIELTADATPNWVSIHPLVLHSGEGRLEVRGHAGRRGSGARFELEALARGGLPVPTAPLLVSNASVRWSGTLSPRHLTFTVTSSGVRVEEAASASADLERSGSREVSSR